MKHEEKALTCLYAITGHDVPEKVISKMPGIAGESLYPVKYKEIAAIAGTARKERLTLDKSAALAYGEILDTLCENFTVLPCRFGTLLKDDDAVTEVLQKRYVFYTRKFKEISGKQEFGLRILWNVIGSDDALSTVGNKPPRGGKEYLLHKVKMVRAGKELKEKRRSAVDKIHKALLDISCRGVKDTAIVANRIVFSGNYLVGKNDRNAFSSKVKAFQKRHPEFKILLTGPWPPYNFVV